MNKPLTIIVMLLSYLCYPQKVTKSYNLSKLLHETSGLEILEDYFITHNDSGNDPALYYLNKKGKIIQKRLLEGHTNIDWEDITKDEAYFYVADMGNNYDTRKDLKIIKVPINPNSVEDIEIISFYYPEQKNFNYKTKSIFDAEALVSVGESLIIFTKNRASKTTQIYKLPKIPGHYEAEKIGSLKTQSIITGADYHEDLRTLALTSTIDFNTYYLLLLENFNFTPKTYYMIDMFEIPIGKSQVEAIKIISPIEFWLTSEDENNSNSALLFRIEL
ncbi:MAG: hypothetical protein ACJ0PS_00740 [Flavobacteriaceae bacterium]